MMSFASFFHFAAATAVSFLVVPHAFAEHAFIEVQNAQVSLIQNTSIAAPMAGIVESVNVTEGEQITAGTLIVQFDSERVQTELTAAVAAHEAVRMQAASDIDARYASRTLEVRERELQQSRNANEKFDGAIPETEIAKLQLVVDQSRLAIEQAEHDREIAAAQAREKEAGARIVEAQLRKHSVFAPKDGIVVEINVEEGEWIEPGKPIARLISTDPIRVECLVDGQAFGKELVGKRVVFQKQVRDGTSKSGNSPLIGKVTFVSPELHPVTGQARLWAEVANPDGVARAGMRGKLIISTPQQSKSR